MWPVGHTHTHKENKKPGKDGRIILIWKFRKCGMGALTGSSQLRKETGGGHL